MSARIKVFLLLIAWCSASKAEQPQAANSYLWEISGKDLKQPSYVFASWHMLCRNELLFHDKVKWAISKSNQLVLQSFIMDISDADYFERKNTYESLDLGTPIYKIDDRKTRKSLLKLIKKHLDLGVNHAKRIAFLPKRMTPFEVYFTSMHSFVENCDRMGSFERLLFNHFKKSKKPIAVIGDWKSVFLSFYQSNFINPQSLIYHIKHIKSQREQFKKIKLAYYVDEDIEAVKELYFNALKNETFDASNLESKMLNNTAKQWLPKLKQILTQDSTFVTVNALYVSGNEGLLTLLKNEGYQVKSL